MVQLRDMLTHQPIKDACRMMGDACLAKGDAASSLAYFQKERDLFGGSEYVLWNIARIQFDYGHFAIAKTEFNRLVKIAPSNPDAWYYLTVIALNDKDIRAHNPT